MTFPLFADNASTTVSSGGTTAPAAGTVETWTVASTATFPAAVTGRTSFRIWDPAAPSEIMEVTSNTGVTLTSALTADGAPLFTALPVTAIPGAVALDDILTIQPAFGSGYFPTSVECSADAAAGATSIPVDSFTPYPDTTGVSNYAIGTLVVSETNPASLATTTWTVVRGVDGTTPVAHTSGFTVEGVLSSTPLRDLLQGDLYLPCLTTAPVGQIGNIGSYPLNGRQVLARLYGPAATVSKVQINVTTTSTGSIDVGVYQGHSIGRGDAWPAPGALLGHSGLISVPAVGFATISLPSSIRVRPGDWFSIACSDNTAEFTGMNTTAGFPLALVSGQLWGSPANGFGSAPPLAQFVDVQANDQGTPWAVLI